jgi:hypothetical protein
MSKLIMSGQYEQYATGEFTAPVAGLEHCGPDNVSPKKFAYEVLIKYERPKLDRRGMLVDNLAFEKYFTALGTITDSCELIARKAAIDFMNMALALCPNCSVTVSVWGIPGRAKVAYLASPKHPRAHTRKERVQ